MNILFICTGNTCRSPMAEAILKHKLSKVNVQSAGIYANDNERANPLTLQTLQQKNIHLNHYSQPVTDELLNWADYVFTMTQSHKQQLLSQNSKHKDKYYVLKDFVSDPEQKRRVELQMAYEKLEYKKELFKQQNKHLSNDEYEKGLKKHLEQDLETIFYLQHELSNIDVTDPFGGTIHTYEETYRELEQLIDRLIKLI